MTAEVHRDVQGPSSIIARLCKCELARSIFIDQGLFYPMAFGLDLSQRAYNAVCILAELVLVKPQILAVLDSLIVEGAVPAFFFSFS